MPVTEIDLGEVDADVVLPPERLAVVNRGGGALDWSVESSVDWVRAERVGNDLVVHLRPNPGPNRANVYVRDALTGAITTVRISVRMRPSAQAESGVVDREADHRRSAAVAPTRMEPEDANPVLLAEQPASRHDLPRPQPVADDESTVVPDETGPDLSGPGPTDPDRTTMDWRPSVERWLPIIAAASAVVAGVLIVTSAFDASAQIKDNYGYRLIVREYEINGLLWEILGGLFLAFAGLLAVRRRSTDVALGAVFGVAVPLGLDRWGAHRQAMNDCGCVGDSYVFAFGGAARWCLWAATVSLIAIFVCRGWATTQWMSNRLVVVTAFLAIGWGAASAIDFYVVYDDRFGSYHAQSATSWHIALTVAILAAIVLASRLRPSVGAGMLVGAVVMPVAALLAEAVFLAGVLDEGTYS